MRSFPSSGLLLLSLSAGCDSETSSPRPEPHHEVAKSVELEPASNPPKGHLCFSNKRADLPLDLSTLALNGTEVHATPSSQKGAPILFVPDAHLYEGHLSTPSLTPQLTVYNEELYTVISTILKDYNVREVALEGGSVEAYNALITQPTAWQNLSAGYQLPSDYVVALGTTLRTGLDPSLSFGQRESRLKGPAGKVAAPLAIQALFSGCEDVHFRDLESSQDVAVAYDNDDFNRRLKVAINDPENARLYEEANAGNAASAHAYCTVRNGFIHEWEGLSTRIFDERNTKLADRLGTLTEPTLVVFGGMHLSYFAQSSAKGHGATAILEPTHYRATSEAILGHPLSDEALFSAAANDDQLKKDIFFDISPQAGAMVKSCDKL